MHFGGTAESDPILGKTIPSLMGIWDPKECDAPDD